MKIKKYQNFQSSIFPFCSPQTHFASHGVYEESVKNLPWTGLSLNLGKNIHNTQRSAQ